MFYIDSSKCTGCGACVEVCRQRAISIHNDLAVINQELCIQYGTCAEICPTGAIHEVAPVYAQLRRGGDEMRGRGWFGRGFGWGYPGWGRGNPYPFCRFYPWLSRRWGAYGPGFYPPGLGAGYMPGYYPPATPAYYSPYTPYQY